MRTALVAALAAVLTLAAGPPARAGEPLARRGCTGASFAAGPGLTESTIIGVYPGGPAAAAGLRAGDIVTQVDGVPVPFSGKERTILGRRSPGDVVRLTYRRLGESRDVELSLIEPITTDNPLVELEFGSVESPSGYRCRVVTMAPSVPVGDGLAPGVLFIGSMDCESVDPATPSETAAGALAERLVEDGAVVVRVERPGLGDSDGPPCEGVSLEEETGLYRAALGVLMADHRVDPSRVVLFARGAGASTASELATDTGVELAGVALYGATAASWHGHLTGSMRRVLDGAAMPASQKESAVRFLGEALAHVLISRTPPAEVAAMRDEYASVLSWIGDTEAGTILGRDWTYSADLQAIDAADRWRRFGANALVVRGEHDRITSASDQARLAEILGESGGNAWSFELPGGDHEMTVHDNADIAIKLAGKGHPPDALAEIMSAWMSTIGAAAE